MIRLGLVGARGYVGQELIGLLNHHDDIEIAYVSSRQLAGQPVAGVSSELRYEALGASDTGARKVDVCVLALPNEKSPPFVAAINEHQPETTIIDLSGDHRFDDQWHYGLPETGHRTVNTTRIANPGCYATAMQLAIWPLRNYLQQPPSCFGVSGYSGAGTTPSPRNDPQALHDNLMPYALTGHLHEREVTRQLGSDVHFTPHVAAFFRGISMTVQMQLSRREDCAYWQSLYSDFYANENLVEVSDNIPQVREVQNRHTAVIGGFSVSEDRLVAVCVLDNLLKGAATQALQNINLACGLPELRGIENG